MYDFSLREVASQIDLIELDSFFVGFGSCCYPLVSGALEKHSLGLSVVLVGLLGDCDFDLVVDFNPVPRGQFNKRQAQG